jgi:hypothetical protein
MVRHPTVLLKAASCVVSHDASSPTYIPYADLTEADVLGWVYASLVEGEETPDEAKARVEADSMQKCKSKLMLRQQLRLVCLGKYLNLALEKGK